MTPEQKQLADKLTNLQLQTVLGVVAGKSQRQAYYDAGGKADNDNAADAIVSRMLGDAKVKALYDSLMADAVTDAVLTRSEAMERLTLMATTQITDILDFETVTVKKLGKDGEEEEAEETIWRMRNSEDVLPRARAAIKSVTITKQGPKIEMYDAKAAMELLGKWQGWEAPTKVDNTHRIVDSGSHEW